MTITFKRKELAILIDALDLLQELAEPDGIGIPEDKYLKLRQVRFKLKRAFDSERGIIC